MKAILGVMVLLAGLITQAGAQQWGAGAPDARPAAVPPSVEASADPRRAGPSAPANSRAAVVADAVITQSHIVRLRATLKLSPAQQSHWAPVEAALSELARQQARGEAAGFTHKFTDRGSAIAATTTQLRRLKAVAMPLINSLDEGQKRDAIAFGRNMGFQQLVAAF